MELDGWLKRENLKGFLVALSEIAEYDFGQLDRGAFESGLSSGGDSGAWMICNRFDVSPDVVLSD
ncbi:hypothetical protein [Streptomyces mobaraensis]|uniref:Uncharacterized protein n=1 Tax=Streptomyces mobaraensis TaxID=35621 RepID=A0A5N5W8G5_STRMB|nr:hypothetical protein [Streptomyces mobaraensis]KAB7845606.1 hypothetical protein FRZ00_14140 [Streptomyces mobaraensis]